MLVLRTPKVAMSTICLTAHGCWNGICWDRSRLFAVRPYQQSSRSPWMHSPLVSKWDPWQGQSKVLSFGLYMTLHFKCGHTAENVFNVPSSSLYAATLSNPTCIAQHHGSQTLCIRHALSRCGSQRVKADCVLHSATGLAKPTMIPTVLLRCCSSEHL